MPRKPVTKKAVWQRTFKLPASVIAAFDAVCEHFDEDPNRVARRFFEDALRSLARDYGLHHVSEILGEKARSPFAFDASPVQSSQETYRAGSAPGFTPGLAPGLSPIQWPPFTQVAMQDVPAAVPADVILPSGGPPPPTQQETE